MQYCMLVSLFLLGTVSSFMPSFPKILQNKKMQIFDPFYDNEEQKSVVFHTAVFNKIPNYVYSDLIDKLNDDNIKVIIPSSDSKKSFKKLDDDLTVVGHSSGAMTAIEASKSKKVKSLVLIDPIDNRFINDDEDEDSIDLNVDKLLLVYTKKSYDWSLFPFSMPFVPENMSLKPKQFNLENNDKKHVIKVSQFGHCDLLDKTWADVADKSIAKGIDKREHINKYHKWLSSVIKCVAFDNIDDIDNEFKHSKIVSPKPVKKDKSSESLSCDIVYESDSEE